MNRCLLLALALCGASGAHAADPLDADQFRAAYCVGAAQVRVLTYEQMAAVACGADLGQCTDVRRLAAAVLPRLRRELEAANAALATYHLLDDGERPEAHRPGVWQQGGEAMATGERDALRCLNLRVPGFPEVAGDIERHCRRVAACSTAPTS
ncbi:hypothetical protein LJ725_27080 [Reyranella aquatilis]|uniref:Lysozyme inhibitor LprI N-terminal domain-containing protein n=1 Tax=Reyranella aquatilis TaxID=2035356 RepID=A0ABS8L2T2_9HYPH|nr:hypothetical protein [Reyranella aquatilis]MCC8432652.1 hypothetical protein [Reyranella aquatilis]